MVFMLVSVFWGLLGTFWFRTQQRTPEIAIRKVNGATDLGRVFGRLISEGLLMLAVATIPALLIDWQLCHYELNTVYGAQGYFSPGRFALTAGATAALMALMVAGGIWFPAYKATRIEPTRAPGRRVNDADRDKFQTRFFKPESYAINTENRPSGSLYGHGNDRGRPERRHRHRQADARRRHSPRTHPQRQCGRGARRASLNLLAIPHLPGPNCSRR